MVTIEKTVNRDLCVGCGICAAACGTGAIEMLWGRDGRPRPRIETRKCVRCGLCANVCPHLPDRMRQEAEKVASAADPGAVGLEGADYFLAWDGEETARRRSASGGAITRVARELLVSGQVDGVVHVRRVLALRGESKYRVVLSRSVTEVEEGRGSAYQALDFSETLQSLESGKRYFVTGTPCVISGLRRLCAASPRFRDIHLTTCALICSHNVTARFSDWLGDRHKLPRDIPWAINMRDKSGIPDANNFNTRISSAEGDLLCENRFASGWTDLWRSYQFALNVCCYCSDFWGREADISVKDAWGKWAEDPLGKSIVIVRDPALKALFPKIGLQFEQLDFKTVLDCQPQETSFKQYEALNKWNKSLRAPENRKSGFRNRRTLASLTRTVYPGLPYAFAHKVVETARKWLDPAPVARSEKWRNVRFGWETLVKVSHSLASVFRYRGRDDPSRQRLILVGGGYGYGNVGDEAQCNATLSLLTRRFPEYQIVDLSPRPDYSHGQHPDFFHGVASRSLVFNQFFPCDCFDLSCLMARLSFRWASILMVLNAYLVRADLPTVFINARKAMLLQSLHTASLFFFCGGGYLTGATESRLLDGLLICRLCQIFKTPVVMSGQTIGLWRGRRQRRLARRSLRDVRLITLRDPAFSASALKEIGICGPHVYPTHDDALFCAKESTRQVAAQKYIVVNFHYWGMAPQDAELALAKLHQMVKWLLSVSDAALVFLPMYDTDRLSFSDYIARHPSDRFTCYDYDFDFRKARRVIADAELCVTMKHHPIIFAMGEDVPVISLAYSDYYVHKNVGALLQYGQGDCSVNFADSGWFAGFQAILARIMAHRSEVISTMRLRRAELVARKERFLKQVGDILGVARLPLDVDFSQQTLPCATAQGLSYAEEWGRWSDGEQVHFVIPCVLKRDVRVEFKDLSALVTEDHPHVTASFFANGTCVANLLFRHGVSWPDATFDVPSTLLDDCGDLDLRIAIDGAVTPVSLGLGQDSRRLGLGFRHLRIDYVSETDSADIAPPAISVPSNSHEE